MARQRKLFMAHAGELAHLLVRTVRPHGMVVDFATSYARRHGRKGVVDDPQRVRELESTLGREAILVMVAEILRLMPSALGARKGRSLGSEEAAFAKMFLPEFMTALVRALEWPPDGDESEKEAFDRDLLMYRRWSEHVVSPDASMPKDGISPFLDRCALLLDPSTMEEARRAAARFEMDLVDAAGRIIGQLGVTSSEKARARKSPRRQRRPMSRRKPAKAKKSKKVVKRPKRRRRS